MNEEIKDDDFATQMLKLLVDNYGKEKVMRKLEKIVIDISIKEYIRNMKHW